MSAVRGNDWEVSAENVRVKIKNTFLDYGDDEDDFEEPRCAPRRAFCTCPELSNLSDEPEAEAIPVRDLLEPSPELSPERPRWTKGAPRVLWADIPSPTLVRTPLWSRSSSEGEIVSLEQYDNHEQDVGSAQEQPARRMRRRGRRGGAGRAARKDKVEPLTSPSGAAHLLSAGQQPRPGSTDNFAKRGGGFQPFTATVSEELPQSSGRGNHVRSRLWCHIYLSPEMLRPGFDLNKKIIGRGGCCTRGIFDATGAKIRLRGRGSGHLEASTGQEAKVPLMLAITGQQDQCDKFGEAIRLCVKLLQDVERRFDAFCEQGRAQRPGRSPQHAGRRYWIGELSPQGVHCTEELLRRLGLSAPASTTSAGRMPRSAAGSHASGDQSVRRRR